MSPPYYDDTEDVHALARNVLNNKDRVDREPLPRRTIELEVAEYALTLLDQLVCIDDPSLIPVAEAFYLAACRIQDKRLGEAISLAWGVCEQLLWLAWKELLADLAERADTAASMSNARRSKLAGRDYTASVVVEVLEMHNRIDHRLYRMLEVGRKARNKWLHEMRVPNEREVHVCRHAARELLRGRTGIPFTLTTGSRGGVPQWPVWMRKQLSVSS